MIKFPPEFYGLAAALWSTYQPAFWVWLALMFSAIVLIGIAIAVWNILSKVI